MFFRFFITQKCQKKKERCGKIIINNVKREKFWKSKKIGLNELKIMEINEIKELEEIEWKIMSQQVKIIEEKIRKRRINKIWYENIKRRHRRRNKGVKKNSRIDKSRIRIIKELKPDFKNIES